MRIEQYDSAPSPLTGSELLLVAVKTVDDPPTYSTRQTTIQSIANRVPIRADSGSDPRDGVRTWLTPYGAGTDTSPADNRTAINSAIFAASSPSDTGSSRVYLPRGRIEVDGPIVLRPGVSLIGQGTRDPSLGVGTLLVLSNDANSNVIQDAYWTSHQDSWGGGSISNLRIDGNQENNSGGGSGIALYGMGQGSRICDVNIANCARYALEITGPSFPVKIERLNSTRCALGTVRVAGSDGTFLLECVSADSGGPLLSATGGDSVSILLNACRQDNSSNNPVMYLDRFKGAVSLNGGAFNATTAAALIRVFTDTGDTPPSVNSLSSIFVKGFDTYLSDESSGGQIIFGPNSFGRWPALYYVRYGATPTVWANDYALAFGGTTAGSGAVLTGSSVVPATGSGLRIDASGAYGYSTKRDTLTNTVTSGWFPL